MISVILPTRESERVLVPTLAALVAGSAAGLVRDVLIADAGSRDDTAKVADAAGCVFIAGPADLGARLRVAAQAARGNWLLFLDPASVLEEGWTRDVRAFVDSTERAGAAERRAATFRLRLEGFGMVPRFAEAAAATRLALIGRPRPEQGLLIAKHFYQTLGGHSEGAAAHRRLVGRIGRRIVVLRTGVTLAAPPA